MPLIHGCYVVVDVVVGVVAVFLNIVILSLKVAVVVVAVVGDLKVLAMILCYRCDCYLFSCDCYWYGYSDCYYCCD